jgi:hypothetical protein
MGIALIGEEVTSLRDKCTGRAPVHFYRKACGVVLGLLLGAAPLSLAEAAPAPAPGFVQSAAAVAAVPGQGVDDFYRAR